ncbi:uncharacterized protein LOC108666448 isoform X1 [Hyalella azteca]|uniref:Uncharacterized protein LOC108666448 isoform X1 n=1 Tax=Hyalella azteca TaxID=294128 RepID=A0A979FW67_HYAAZ|nr:uncharacterized protein LOC108666448 isoform X1 [Hyalella azteca]XP_047740636.1 uncharacterized protein LOC108666448 isoform X1 [Hyalella azteca]
MNMSAAAADNRQISKLGMNFLAVHCYCRHKHRQCRAELLSVRLCRPSLPITVLFSEKMPSVIEVRSTRSTAVLPRVASKEVDGEDGLRLHPQKVTHSLNEEFLGMAVLALASVFALFCCPIFVERPASRH